MDEGDDEMTGAVFAGIAGIYASVIGKISENGLLEVVGLVLAMVAFLVLDFREQVLVGRIEELEEKGRKEEGE